MEKSPKMFANRHPLREQGSPSPLKSYKPFTVTTNVGNYRNFTTVTTQYTTV